MSISFTGIASGIDTAALVDSMIGVASIPKLMLQSKVSAQRQEISALQTLNTQVATLATQAGDLARTGALALFTTSASSDAVSATAGEGAAPGSIEVVVDRVAAAQQSVTAAWSTAPATVLTITDAAGEHTEIHADSDSVDDVVRAVNNADAGVRAVKVPAGTDTDGTPRYRIQLTATATGAASAFTVHAGTAADVAAGTAVDLLTQPGAATVTQAADAQLRLYAGTDAEQTLTSATNTFTGLLPGVDLTVARAGSEPVTVTVADDTDAREQAVRGLVDAVVSLLGQITSRTQVTTGADGSVTSAGLLQGESIIRDLRNAVLRATTDPVDGSSPSTIGIEITRYGTVELDVERFTRAMTTDPERTAAMVATIAGRIQETAESFSDRYDGKLTKTIESRQSAARRIDDQILEWDVRLDLKRRNLTRQFVHMETQLAALQSTSAWLTSQLAALTPNQPS